MNHDGLIQPLSYGAAFRRVLHTVPWKISSHIPVQQLLFTSTGALPAQAQMAGFGDESRRRSKYWSLQEQANELVFFINDHGYTRPRWQQKGTHLHKRFVCVCGRARSRSCVCVHVCLCMCFRWYFSLGFQWWFAVGMAAIRGECSYRFPEALRCLYWIFSVGTKSAVSKKCTQLKKCQIKTANSWLPLLKE